MTSYARTTGTPLCHCHLHKHTPANSMDSVSSWLDPFWLASGHTGFYQAGKRGLISVMGRGLASIPVGVTLGWIEFKYKSQTTSPFRWLERIKQVTTKHEFVWERQGCREEPLGQDLQVIRCHRWWSPRQASVMIISGIVLLSTFILISFWSQSVTRLIAMSQLKKKRHILYVHCNVWVRLKS